MIKTRFAPSPTGYLHIGGVRTALFSWAFARKHHGQFVLRIEDTDLERSSEISVKAIIDGMSWLGLDWDEGPIRQTERLARYNEIAMQLVEQNLAYRCYCSHSELEEMRASQRKKGEKPRYDGRWRPENVQALRLSTPRDIKPVLRFRNPSEGDVVFRDLVKGAISVSNRELDDLVIMRADGVPTYNFGVVVDDIDMGITHVIRGEDHVNNTPRQLNIYRAIGARVPQFAHVPMILGADGERLSKRHGAVSVLQYRDDGFLAESILNYLGRLGWSHGDAELFSLSQFVDWFDFDHVNKSPAQFDPTKLRWINQQYMKEADDERLAALVQPVIDASGGRSEDGPPLIQVVALLKARSETLGILADEASMFYVDNTPAEELLTEYLTTAVRPVLADLASVLAALPEWNADVINASIRDMLKKYRLKMSKLAIPVRVCVFGRTNTPDLATVLSLAGKSRVTERLQRFST